MTRLPDSPTVLWRLHTQGQRYTCAVRLTPAGLRLEQSMGTQRLMSQTFQTADELYRQAEVAREQCLEDGWTEEE